jgi:hypothetical protein
LTIVMGWNSQFSYITLENGEFVKLLWFWQNHFKVRRLQKLRNECNGDCRMQSSATVKSCGTPGVGVGAWSEVWEGKLATSSSPCGSEFGEIQTHFFLLSALGIDMYIFFKKQLDL